MSNPEEIITFDPHTEQVIRHETVDGAENFADEVGLDQFIQVVETNDLDQTFNTFRNE